PRPRAPRGRGSAWRACKSFSSIEQTRHHLAKTYTMTGLPTRFLDEKGWPSSGCDSKLGSGRPRSSFETDGMSAAAASSTLRPMASVPATSRVRQRRRRVSGFIIIITVPRPSARSGTRTARRVTSLIESFRGSPELVTLDEGHVCDRMAVLQRSNHADGPKARVLVVGGIVWPATTGLGFCPGV